MDPVTFTITFIIAFIGIMVFVGHRELSKEKGRRAALEKKIAALPGFSPAVRYEQSDKQAMILLDPESSQFAITKAYSSVRLYQFDQLVGVEIERNGSALELTSRGSQMMGAAVGGALLGPVGMIVGGLSGSKRQVQKIERLSLKLYTTDLHEPVTNIIFFAHPGGRKADHEEVKEAIANLEQWYGRFLTIKSGRQTAQAPLPQEGAQGGSFGRRRNLVAN